jgi:tight adherence protein B
MIEDYNYYCYKVRDYIIIAMKSFATCLSISYLFYQKLSFAILLSPYSIYIAKNYQEKKVIKRKQQLNIQFRDAIQAISSALEAGYSMENAIRSAITDLEMMYERNAIILVEFRRMTAMIQNNTSVEEAMEQFANRSKLEDILCFSEVFHAAKRSGGDLVQIIRSTSKTLVEKIEIHREIETLISAKKLETQIMKFMPVAILAYFMLCNPSFLLPIYNNIFGGCFMTVMLTACFGISKIADSIMKIEV